MTEENKLIENIKLISNRIREYETRPGRVNESNTIRGLITPIISALGWNVEDLDEVQSEYRHKSSDNPVDYALFIDGMPSLFIEAKALDEKLDDRKWIIQTLNYANACNVAWAVLTNGEEWRVYNVHVQREAEDKLFYSAKLTDSNFSDTASRLLMLGKTHMAPQLALDTAWREAEVDGQMRRVIENLPENKSAVRALSKASDGLTEKDVRDALRRLKIRIDWRDDADLFSVAVKEPSTVNGISKAPNSIVDSSVKSVILEDTFIPKNNKKENTCYEVWPDRATHIMNIGLHVSFGLFDTDKQKLKILSGSKVSLMKKNDTYVPRALKDWIEEAIENGSIIVKSDHMLMVEDSEFLSPSSAAGMVTFASVNGWNSWKDKEGRKLQILRN